MKPIISMKKPTPSVYLETLKPGTHFTTMDTDCLYVFVTLSECLTYAVCLNLTNCSPAFYNRSDLVTPVPVKITVL